MAYYIGIFSPETYEAFVSSKQDVSGVRERYENLAKRVKVGDKLICYVTKLSRWFGVLEVKSQSFRDTTPRFKDIDDPYVIRFKINVLTLLPKEKAIPIKEDNLWNQLSFTKDYDKLSNKWTGKFRGNINAIDEADGKFLEELILSQVKNGKTFPIDEQENTKLLTHRVRSRNKVVSVSVPQETELETDATMLLEPEVRQSIKIQTLLAGIGAHMGLKIWVPRNNKASVLTGLKSDSHLLLDVLPLNYDETTLRTVEQIDVLWLRGRYIVRAFEVEHSTSIYSGILRMADLLALQPNMNIKLHIVAPSERREKVFHELRRPVFSLLEAGPLAERCTYLSYDSIEELWGQKHLAHLADSVLDEYAEEAE
jgi:predicted RNA-binding protein